MKKLVKLCGWMAVVLLALTVATSCKSEPKKTDVEFSYATFDCQEGEKNAYISVYLMYSPYKFPVLVDMEVEMISGKDAAGNDLVLDDVIEFIETDKSYTVTKTGDRTAKIEGVEVTYSTYNQKVYFNAKQNDFLQNEDVVIEFKLTQVDGSNIGSITSTKLTVVDDEKAPLVKIGYYNTAYTPAEGAERADKGQFYLRLQKVGKYEYVASEWFGLSRPRLLGKYDPEANTITFDGTDYDHVIWEQKIAELEEGNEYKVDFTPVSAFQNDTIWGYSYNEAGKLNKVLRMYGAGADGTAPIVMTTEAIEENKDGVILSIDTECGFEIYSFNADTNKAGAKAGIYDGMTQSDSMIFSKTNYEEEGTRAMGAGVPFLLSGK